MKVELKQIIDQLTETISLKEGQKVSALVDEDKIVGWMIVDVFEDGTIKPIDTKVYKNLRELIYEKI